jgi:arginyl-tRNA synthetase
LGSEGRYKIVLLHRKSPNMSIISAIRKASIQAFQELYAVHPTEQEVLINSTKPEFEGDYTVVLFSFVKQLKKSPDQLGQELGKHLQSQNPALIADYNVVKGFLNLTVSENYWIDFLEEAHANPEFGKFAPNGLKTVVEYSSPNTNKPLHLGHLRNNFLGWSVAEILKASGQKVIKTSIVNDRGIHICKSMLAWKKLANGATPESTGMKGDHFVGDYYVKFEHLLKEEAQVLFDRLMAGDIPENLALEDQQKCTALLEKLAQKDLEAEKKETCIDALKELARNATDIMAEVRAMLLQWEEGQPDVLQLWKTMNGWVYAGFEETYTKIGSDFHKTYYESETYLLGKKFVEEGLKDGVFFKKEDGSVWIDLTEAGLDEKLVLRKDGTSVYITQDLGLAKLKSDDFGMDKSLYVIGDEQNYHMKVLQLICQKLQLPHADGIQHLSYGMVELPNGRMKSREGTVVDADDLVAEMEAVALKHTLELGKVDGFSEQELKELSTTIGLGALKFFLLRVDPKKKMIFNPEESIDFHGFTAPFVQYTHARIQSILRKSNLQEQTDGNEGDVLLSPVDPAAGLTKQEKEILVQLEQWPGTIQTAAQELSPSLIALYVFNLAKTFNSFLAHHSILKAESTQKKELRLHIAGLCARVIKHGMKLLGIAVPDKM